MAKNFYSNLIFLVVLFFAYPLCAQSEESSNLENRMQSMEEYLQTFQPTVTEFYNSLQNDLQNYSQSLEKSLNDFAANLQANLETRLSTLNEERLVLDLKSTSYSKIDTNSGFFLIAVNRVEPTKGGFKLHLNIGNPYFADYKDFVIRIFFGKQWKGTPDNYSWQEWHDSLKGLEFEFQGTLLKGIWNPVEVNLIPATQQDIEYVEMEMDVLSIELQSAK